jgi:N-acetylmuramoyl-L-alanine amidase
VKNNKSLIAIVVILIGLVAVGLIATVLVAMPKSKHSTVKTTAQVAASQSSSSDTVAATTEDETTYQTTAAAEEVMTTEAAPTEETATIEVAGGAGTIEEETLEEEMTEEVTTQEATTEEATTKEVKQEIAKKNREKTVVVDAGHQAKGDSSQEPIGPGASETKDKVASGAEGEYEITLQVSLKLRDELESRGYTVVMTRETNDVNISNKERAEIANEQGDIFIRIHCNDDNSSSPKGALTMCGTASNPYCADIYQQSRKLSDSVLSGLCAATGAKNRGVTETDTMSGINWCTVPVTIVEMGFLSNPSENKLLHDDSYQDQLAQGIANGIDAYYDN